MDKLDIHLLKNIEQALGFKLQEWQINYILDIPMVLDMKITGRQTGKTLVYTIKKLFSNDIPIRVYNLDDLLDICDWFSTSENERYIKWYSDYLTEIYMLLIKNGITPRQLIFKKKDPKLRDEVVFDHLENYREMDRQKTNLYYKQIAERGNL